MMKYMTEQKEKEKEQLEKDLLKQELNDFKKEKEDDAEIKKAGYEPSSWER